MTWTGNISLLRCASIASAMTGPGREASGMETSSASVGETVNVQPWSAYIFALRGDFDARIVNIFRAEVTPSSATP